MHDQDRQPRPDLSRWMYERTARELANEKWWHLWAQVAITFVGTVVVMLLLARIL